MQDASAGVHEASQRVRQLPARVYPAWHMSGGARMVAWWSWFHIFPVVVPTGDGQVTFVYAWWLHACSLLDIQKGLPFAHLRKYTASTMQ